MMRYSTRTGLGCLMVLLASALPAMAGPIVAGQTTFVGRAIQDVRVLGGTTINPGPEFVMDDLFGDGFITIARQAQSGSTISFTGVDSVFAGSRPEIGPFTFGAAGAVGVGSFLGTIDNVVQDVNDPGFPSGDPSSFLSGDLTLEVPSFYFRLGNGVILETGATFTFSATLDGLPPRSPTLLEGRTPINEIPVYLGNPLDPNDRELVGFSSDRRILLSVVPEPSSLALLGVGALGLLGYGWRRSRAGA